MHYELFLKVVFYAISRLELTVTWSENCMTQSGFGCLGNWPCSFHLGSRTNHWRLGRGWVICFIRKLTEIPSIIVAGNYNTLFQIFGTSLFAGYTASRFVPPFVPSESYHTRNSSNFQPFVFYVNEHNIDKI